MNKNGFSLIQIIIALVVIFAIAETYYLVLKNYRSGTKNIPQDTVIKTSQPIPANIPSNGSNNSMDINIEPNISFSKEEWSVFTFPSGGYSFEFPSDWKITVTAPARPKDKFYEVSLSYYENGRQWPIKFMTGGHGGFNCDYEKEEIKKLGNRTTKWNKCFLNNLLINSVITFPNKEFENYFIGIEMLYFPPTNQQKYEKIMEEIISSLKEYPGKKTNF